MFRKTILTMAMMLMASYAPAQMMDLSGFSHWDPSNQINTSVLKEAAAYFARNRDTFRNQNTVTIIDMNLHSSRPRMFLIDVRSGAVTALRVSHGQGSDRNNDGIADRFSNANSSHATSLGAYRIGNQRPSPKFGRALELDGLSPGLNDNARRRAVIIHPAPYVNSGRVGRSWGCPAVSPNDYPTVVRKTAGGSFLWIAGPRSRHDSSGRALPRSQRRAQGN